MDERVYTPFIKSVKDIVRQMTGIEVNVPGSFYSDNEDIVSYGVSSIIAFAGKIKGRLLLDFDHSLALAIAKNVNGEEYTATKDYMVLATISEVNNIVSGDGLTKLNNEYALSLRLAPPIVFAGKSPIVSIPKIPSVSLDCETEFGRLKVNIAFEGGI